MDSIMMHLLKRFFVVVVVAVSLGLIAGPAVASSPHVVKGPDVSVSGTSITVTASIAGLGNVPSADFSLTGTIDVFSRCYNAGGNKPQADNKQETIDVNAFGSFPVRNGRTNVSFTVWASSTLSCPGNQRVVIESFSWDLTLSGEGLNIQV
jgi:hypothetical protein